MKVNEHQIRKQTGQHNQIEVNTFTPSTYDEFRGFGGEEPTDLFSYGPYGQVQTSIWFSFSIVGGVYRFQGSKCSKHV